MSADVKPVPARPWSLSLWSLSLWSLDLSVDRLVALQGFCPSQSSPTPCQGASASRLGAAMCERRAVRHVSTSADIINGQYRPRAMMYSVGRPRTLPVQCLSANPPTALEAARESPSAGRYQRLVCPCIAHANSADATHCHHTAAATDTVQRQRRSLICLGHVSTLAGSILAASPTTPQQDIAGAPGRQPTRAGVRHETPERAGNESRRTAGGRHATRGPRSADGRPPSWPRPAGRSTGRRGARALQTDARPPCRGRNGAADCDGR